LIDKFDHALSPISDFPGMGAERDELKPGMRSYPVGEYLLFYVQVEGGIELVRVLHGMRDLRDLFPTIRS
jgi:toxin ParE1/3/4